MSLVTRCPECRTLFRVTPEHLQAAGGQVRCGRCTNVFDGYAALAPDPNAPKPEPGAAKAAEKSGASAPAPVIAAATSPTPSATPAAKPTAPVQPAATVSAITPPPRMSRATRRYAAVIAVLVLALAAQIGYAFRAEFIARSMPLRATLENICEFAGCMVMLPQRPDLLRIEASDVHMIDPARASLIQLTATMRSYAKHDLAYPALDLVLTNANEHALARRVFLPDEYLGPGRNPRTGIPPNGEVTVALDLETGDLNAAGFRLDLLAAPVK